MPLILLSAGWVVGIFLGTRFDLPLLLALAGLLPLPLLFLLKKHRRVIISGSLSLIALFTASWYSYQSLNVTDAADLSFYNDRGRVEIRGLVA